MIDEKEYNSDDALNRECEEYEEDVWFECSCGWFGKTPVVIKEFGMTFYICESCGSEVY